MAHILSISLHIVGTHRRTIYQQPGAVNEFEVRLKAYHYELSIPLRKRNGEFIVIGFESSVGRSGERLKFFMANMRKNQMKNEVRGETSQYTGIATFSRLSIFTSRKRADQNVFGNDQLVAHRVAAASCRFAQAAVSFPLSRTARSALLACRRQAHDALEGQQI